MAKPHKQIITLLRESVNSFVAHPIILLPFITIAFIQLLILEIIYFTPRFPLVNFFGPIIQRMEGEAFLHYPQHLLIVSKWFSIAQYFLFIFVSCFFIGVAIEIIKNINNNRKISFSAAIRNLLPQYVHIWLAAIIMFLVFYLFKGAHEMIIERAAQIRSQSGPFYIIKAAVFHSTPYLSLLVGVLVTTLFAFILPIIVIDRQKIFSALFQNFKNLWGSFWFILVIVLIPMLFYIPVLILQSNLSSIADLTFEGVRMLSPVLSILVLTFIDATVYTAITTYFLLKRETP